MEHLELIEAYFNDELTTEKKSEFERKIIADPAFAEEAAFYLSSKQAAASALQEDRTRLKGVYEQYKRSNVSEARNQAPVRKLWRWVAAAAVVAGIIFSWYSWFKPVSLPRLADKYINANFQDLSVTMGGREDSLQAAIRMYNDGKFEEALDQFENMALRDSSMTDAMKYAGIVSLRLGQYDKAITHFSELSNHKLYVNPGKFYHALTLLKRNLPGDKQQAKILLEQVVQEDLVGKATAREWLDKW